MVVIIIYSWLLEVDWNIKINVFINILWQDGLNYIGINVKFVFIDKHYFLFMELFTIYLCCFC
jgi:hypothetical protein